jgi:hypothetical protein
MRTAKRLGILVLAGALVGEPVGVSCLVGAAAGALVACNQDSYASTPERDTHMGEIVAAPEPSGTIRTPASAAVSTPPPPPAPSSKTVH